SPPARATGSPVRDRAARRQATAVHGAAARTRQCAADAAAGVVSACPPAGWETTIAVPVSCDDTALRATGRVNAPGSGHSRKDGKQKGPGACSCDPLSVGLGGSLLQIRKSVLAGSFLFAGHRARKRVVWQSQSV